MLAAAIVISSLLATLGLLALAWGYRASLFSGDPATRWFARSTALLAVSVFGRRFTWDVLHPVISGDIDQRPLNIALNIVAMAAVYAGLKARLLLIPDDERHRWRWWSAWRHPAIWRVRDDRPIGAHEDRP